MATDQSLEWQQARQWLINSGVIPVTNKVTKPGVDLVDFVRSLRDGVFLCSLLNKLRPDVVPENEFNPKPLMQHSYLKNISTFLHICETKFRLKESDLFVESDLYDVDNFQKVVQLLSKLSHTPEALQLGWVPFPRFESRNYYNEPPVNGEEDIYASLKDIGMERLYANVGEFVPPEEEEDPYSFGDDTIYDSICYYQAPPVKTSDADEKKTYVMKELFETERSFLTVLHLICQEFFSAMCELICADDVELIFSTAKELYPIHCALLESFEKCQEPGGDISKGFLDASQGLLQYGIYAAKLPKAVERAKQLQNRRETGQVLQACQDRSGQRFPLKDLLNVPIQRFLKYPLLIKELHKCSLKASMPSQSEVNNLEAVLDLLEDIAKYINITKGNYEGMRQIEEVELSLDQYRGPSLTTYGNYHLDGELRIKSVDGGTTRTPRWVFLFDKMMLICHKKSRLRLVFEVRYSVKHTFAVRSLRVEPITNPTSRGGNFSQGFKLIVKDHGEFLAYAKTEELKSQWIDAINHAREMSSPRDGKKGHHTFELYTFEKPSYCDVCHKLLHGCYFQGYFCPACSRAAHRECLSSAVSCSMVHHMTPPTASAPPPHRRLMPSRSGSTDRPTPVPRAHVHPMPSNGVDSKRGLIYVAKQRYDAIGSRTNRVLSFDRGEELEVLSTVAGADWWEAISLKTGNRGEVPSSYLVPKGSSLDPDGPDIPTGASFRSAGEGEAMLGYPWYFGKKSRIEAEQTLHKMRDGVFLIRESDVRDGEYAIALKWNRMPKHIKICKHPITKKYFVADVCEFASVADLVAYYRNHSLGASFPGVDTPLKYSFKEMMTETNRRNRSISNPPPPQVNPPPSPVSVSSPGEKWADVLFNFPAEYPDELSIDKHDRVKILEKDTNMLGWWLGECKGKKGLFPSNYVREITS